MNYLEMSDFEINKAVADSTGYDGRTKRHRLSERAVFISDGVGGFIRDYCNSWADAGPIIQGNEISMISRRANGEWKAEIFLGRKDIFDNYATFFDKNPLRAAMIIFLMMKDEEAKNESH